MKPEQDYKKGFLVVVVVFFSIHSAILERTQYVISPYVNLVSYHPLLWEVPKTK